MAKNLNLAANKQNAIAFYHTAYLGKPAQAVADYVGAEYIQHNPLVGNGKQAFIDYFEAMARDYPDKSITFIRAIAEDDLVALHTHQVWPGNDEYVTMDFSVLMKMARLLSIGMPFKGCQMKQKTVIRCTNSIKEI